MLETFDAVPGNVSCVRRNRSNTPLQALTSLNEPLMMECARRLAELTLEQDEQSDAARLSYAMRRCVSRAPSAEEIDTLTHLLENQRTRIDAGELDAEQIAGAGPNAPQRAVWTLVARVLLSLDETMTKE